MMHTVSVHALLARSPYHYAPRNSYRVNGALVTPHEASWCSVTRCHIARAETITLTSRGGCWL